ncbi:MAG: type V CRISPR-associated protein Cas4 [Weeksellaceae bacterium]|nr:type V CRISPR-associated protein Cas4 [Bacteroidota bacterium]MCG2779413.1 type V CRISPR-associated protein Cas4 [Weeksellaceae bacterium]
MEFFLAITTLNDFIFCPYSIYLHEIYNYTKEDTYHSKSQSKGRRLHDFIENDTNPNDWKSAFVYSEKLKIYGKIDDYDTANRELIEYKSTVATAFKGYYYQIWAQYLCLSEMGIIVEKLAFYDFRVSKKIEIPLPSNDQLLELECHVRKVQQYDFNSEIKINPNKCRRCIYQNLCEKVNF